LLSLLIIVIIGFVARSADAQPVFSITWHGPPKGMPSGFGPPITEGDLLIPGLPPTFAPAFAAMPVPAIVVPGGFGPPGLALPLYPGAVGLGPGVPGFVELDAVSFGTDLLLRPGAPATSLIWAFSVDEFSVGVAGPIPPNVFTMGPAGAGEASADIFVDVGIGGGPFCGLGPGAGNTTLLDCNGIAPPAGFPGIMGPAFVEPNFPGAGVPDMGADIDALDIDPPPGPSVMPAPVPGVGFPIYYSLDSAIFNPVEGVPNIGSAAANGGFTGADILVCAGPGVGPALYAAGFMLGLPGAGNDVDGLILRENGVPGYQPPTVPFSWVPGVVPIPTDMIFFSVRPGSAVVGVPDSMCGTPISPADILWPPMAVGFPPRKWIPAAQLGLMPTDNIDALDLLGDCNGNGFPDNLEVKMGFAGDCNGNLIPDSCDISSGLSLNINGNTIPDECECLADSTGNGVVDIDDLVKVITQWGPCPGCPPAHCGGDVTWDCVINIDDLVKVITAWGTCP
jgi:hypothetical protein